MRGALLALALVGCWRKTEGAMAFDVRAATEELFVAATARDCPAARRLVADVVDDHACAEFFDEWLREGIRLVRVDEVSRDGRDAEAWIVRALVLRGDDPKPQPLLIRATPDGSAWKLHL